MHQDPNNEITLKKIIIIKWERILERKNPDEKCFKAFQVFSGVGSFIFFSHNFQTLLSQIDNDRKERS